MDTNGAHGTWVQAYSPFNGGALYNDATCERIGKAHGKTASQVALRWILERNATVSVYRDGNKERSTSLKYLQQDFDIFDFSLNDTELHQLDGK